MTRSYRLASTGMQSVLNSDILNQLTPANLSTDVDVVAIHQDFYGLPWDELEASQPPPTAWAAAMDTLLQQAGGKDIFLSLQLVSGEAVIKSFATMGVRTYDGTLKSLTGARWQTAQQLRFAQ